MDLFALHKRLSKVSCKLDYIAERVGEESLKEEIYEARREILKIMIRIENTIWENKRKEEAKCI